MIYYLCEHMPLFPFLGAYCYNCCYFRILLLLQAPQQMILTVLTVLQVAQEYA